MEARPRAESASRAKAPSPAAVQTCSTRTIARKATLVTPPESSAPSSPGASPYASGFQAWNGASPIFVP